MQIPDAKLSRTLITTTLVALNHGNLTGNYTVLRDLGVPLFQSAYSAARLSQIFAKLRKRQLDLGAVILFEPQFIEKPTLSKSNVVRYRGRYPTRPLQVHFDLHFQPHNNRWRLYGIAVELLSPGARSANRKPAK